MVERTLALALVGALGACSPAVEDEVLDDGSDAPDHDDTGDTFADDYVDSRRATGTDVSRSQLLLELSYRLQVTPWLTLQPTVQLFGDAHFSRRDTTTFGIQANVNL